MKKLKSGILKFVVLLFGFSLASCGGGGGGGGGLPNPTAPGTGTVTSTVTITPTNPSPLGTFTMTIEIPDATELYQADIAVAYDNSIIEITNTGSPTSSVSAGVLPDIMGISWRTPSTLFDVADENLLATFNDYNGVSYNTWTGTNGTICDINFIVLSGSAVSTKIVLQLKYRFGATGSTVQTINATKFINIQ